MRGAQGIIIRSCSGNVRAETLARGAAPLAPSFDCDGNGSNECQGFSNNLSAWETTITVMDDGLP
jgi:hypothetical protein